jgi:hypothetical protein
MVTIAILLAASRALHSGEGETGDAGEGTIMNLLGSIVKTTAKMVTTTQKSVNVESAATLMGTVASITKKSWAEGVAQANGKVPKEKKEGASKLDRFVAATKAKTAAAKAAYQAAASK